MSNQTSTGRVTNGYDVLIILIVLGTIVGLTYLITGKYSVATDAATVAGVIFPSITAIVAAAFGVSQAARASTAERKAEDAEKKVIDKNKTADEIKKGVSKIKTKLQKTEPAKLQMKNMVEEESVNNVNEIESIKNEINNIEFMLNQF